MIAAITTRITKEANYFELRDSISHDLLENISKHKYLPLLVSNSHISPEKFYQNFKFDILILSGGDDLIFKQKSSV